MSNPPGQWFDRWFNRDYLKLYPHRDPEEASGQIDFLIHALNLQGEESVLDLGCGTGRHAIALARRGYDVTGIDLSAFLIGQGVKWIKTHPGYKIELIAGDMFSWTPKRRYDLVINMFTSFGYFSEDLDNERFFDVIKRGLVPGGKFFIDYLHPSKVLRDLKKSSYEVKEVEGERVEIWKTIECDQVVKKIVFPHPMRTYFERVKLYPRDKIERMLTQKGFSIMQVWNDYEGGPWREDGDRQLFYGNLKMD